MSKTFSPPKKDLNKNILNLNTPQLLKGGMYLIWMSSALLLITTIAGVQTVKTAIKTVGKDSAPSIITAQRIKDSLADLDANAANELIAKPGQNQDAVKNYEERREKVTTFLVAAAENITFGDAERIPIINLQLGLGEYIAKIQQARDFHQRGETAGVLKAYREAAEIMDKKLLPAADDLNTANVKVLDRVYNDQRSTSLTSFLLILFTGLILISLLVIMQIFIKRKMRRIINPLLLTSTLISSGFIIYITSNFAGAYYHLKVAKEDAFNSIYALRKTRAIAYSANGDESRYLLDNSLSSQHEQAFYNKINQLIKLPAGQNLDTAVNLIKQNQKVPNFSGYLADALNNVTFPGEKDALTENIATLAIYLKIDKQIRQLQQSGKRAEAIALCIGDNQGESNWAFEQFRQANQKAIDINLAAFNQSIEQSEQKMKNLEITTSAVIVTISLLTLLGLMPRIKEYN